jgi:hypothetical protein
MSAKSIRANTDVERVLCPNTLRVLRLSSNGTSHDLLRSLLHNAWHAGYDYGRLCQAEELVALQKLTERPTLTVDAQLDAAMRQLREAVEGKCL